MAPKSILYKGAKYVLATVHGREGLRFTNDANRKGQQHTDAPMYFKETHGPDRSRVELRFYNVDIDDNRTQVTEELFNGRGLIQIHYRNTLLEQVEHQDVTNLKGRARSEYNGATIEVYPLHR